jgi:pSer/pThr/pTyr-binding forkhead associated (FHA) protein
VLTSSGFKGSTAQATPMSVPNAVVGTIAQDGSAPGRLPAPHSAVTALFKLVSVNRDGSDGVSFPVTGERLDIGRRTGTLLFEDDGYLSDRHVRLEQRDGKYHLVDLDSLNGVYVRIRQKEELRDGIRILVGMEVLCFELISEQERDPAPAVEHGVLVFGTPPKLPWARLRQVTTAGMSRDIFHLYRAEVVVGRESGDIVFSDDDFMSRMHAAIRNEGGKAWLVDLNSSNGTYLQVDKERLLEPGDFIRLGDQLLRFEAV